MKTKTYNIEIREIGNNTHEMSRTNDGFTPYELIGLMEYIKEEVVAQLKGDIKPNIVKRNVVTDK